MNLVFSAPHPHTNLVYFAFEEVSAQWELRCMRVDAGVGEGGQAGSTDVFLR